MLKEMEQALKKNKTLEKLTIRNENEVFNLPKEFCYHFLLGARQNTSLSYLRLDSLNLDCSGDGRLAYSSHILCDSVGCSVYVLCCNKQ